MEAKIILGLRSKIECKKSFTVQSDIDISTLPQANVSI